MAIEFGRAAMWLALSLCAAAPSQAQLQGENFLVTMPPGFKVGFQDSKSGMNMQEWVPAGETVQNWSEMVTVQVFLKRTDLDPGKMLQVIQTQWQDACKGSSASPIVSGKTNGFPVSTVLLRCPLLAGTGKPETTMFRAIKGNDSFYMVQRAVRSTPTPDQLERTKAYLEAATVCDSRSAAHPCPAVSGPR